MMTSKDHIEDAIFTYLQLHLWDKIIKYVLISFYKCGLVLEVTSFVTATILYCNLLSCQISHLKHILIIIIICILEVVIPTQPL